MSDLQSLYQDAIKFATYKHLEKKQKISGTNLPYVVHLSNVAMEIFVAAQYTEDFNLGFAVQVALLHDTIEDTMTTYGELKEIFGSEIADAVLALTKDSKLPKKERMIDSLSRIKKSSKEVWSVKLADRITNLQKPPSGWSGAIKNKYREEAKFILVELEEGNKYLAKRIKIKIEEYNTFV